MSGTARCSFIELYRQVRQYGEVYKPSTNSGGLCYVTWNCVSQRTTRLNSMTEQSPQNFTLYIACTKLRKVYNKGVQQEILTNAVHDPAAFLWEWNCISPSQGNGHGTIFRKSEEIGMSFKNLTFRSVFLHFSDFCSLQSNCTVIKCVRLFIRGTRGIRCCVLTVIFLFFGNFYSLYFYFLVYIVCFINSSLFTVNTRMQYN